jgi:hypothetical protein
MNATRWRYETCMRKVKLRLSAATNAAIIEHEL